MWTNAFTGQSEISPPFTPDREISPPFTPDRDIVCLHGQLERRAPCAVNPEALKEPVADSPGSEGGLIQRVVLPVCNRRVLA